MYIIARKMPRSWLRESRHQHLIDPEPLVRTSTRATKIIFSSKSLPSQQPPIEESKTAERSLQSEQHQSATKSLRNSDLLSFSLIFTSRHQKKSEIVCRKSPRSPPVLETRGGPHFLMGICIFVSLPFLSLALTLSPCSYTPSPPYGNSRRKRKTSRCTSGRNPAQPRASPKPETPSLARSQDILRKQKKGLKEHRNSLFPQTFSTPRQRT